MKKYKILLLLLMMLYIIVNLFTIERFPFVHSDELWLSLLSQDMADQGSLQVTESFFDLFPRVPHAIKVFYHVMQALFFQAVGLSVMSIRTLSFLWGLLSVILTYLIFERLTNKRLLTLLYTGLYAFNIQLLYASHFGRQEIVILTLMVLSQLILLRTRQKGHEDRLISPLILSLLTGFAIGIHPNSFLMGLMIAVHLFFEGHARKNYRPTGVYVVTTGLLALGFVLQSFFWRQSFLTDYLELGQQLGTGQSLVSKVALFPVFLYKIYQQIGGTYYLPNLQVHMILFVVAGLLALLTALFKGFDKPKEGLPEAVVPLLSIAALTGGLIIIGRYNTTAVVFYLPLCLMVLYHVLKKWLPMRWHVACVVLLLAFTSLQSLTEMTKAPLEPYAHYHNEIISHIKEDAVILGNLNAGLAFDGHRWYDYRNLDYLDEAGLTLDAYLASRHIDTIVWSEEMDYIARNLDPWSILYGEMPYYQDLVKRIEEDYVALHHFESPLYGMRIAAYTDGYPWRVTIYQKKTP